MKVGITFSVAMILAGILLSPLMIRAALIKGTVTDTLIKVPVESVLVTVKGTSTKAYTNAQGIFSLTTTNGIRMPEQNILLSSMKAGASIEVYGANGSRLASGKAENTDAFLSGLPDGVYVVATDDRDGRSFYGKIIKLNGVSRTGDLMGAAAKTSANVTLVYTHKYYTTKEAAANEGDTSVAAKLRMWFPDSTTTGVPAGTVLTASGGVVISANGTILEKKDISGDVQVNANNVIIRKCRIRVDTWFQIKYNWYSEGYTNLLVEDCEIDGTNGLNTMIAIGGYNYTLRRCNIHGSGDGPRVTGTGTTLIEDCYVHDLANPDGAAHNDAVDLAGGAGVVVRHNTIYNKEGQTSCITASANNTLIQYNLLAGAGYTIYGGGTNVRIVNNCFSRKYFTNCGSYGVKAYWTDTGNQWSGNVWYETGLTCQ